MSECVRCGKPTHFGSFTRDGKLVGLCFDHLLDALSSDIDDALAEKAERECGV